MRSLQIEFTRITMVNTTLNIVECMTVSSQVIHDSMTRLRDEGDQVGGVGMKL